MRYSKYEYEKFARSVYKKHDRCGYTFLLTLPSLILVSFVIGIYYDGEVAIIAFLVVGVPLLFIILAGCLFIQGFLENKMDRLVAAGQDLEKEQAKSAIENVNQRMMMMANAISNVKSTGNIVMTGNGSTVIIDSYVISSFNKIEEDDPLLADAIKTISGCIERSEHKDAGDVWTRFLKEMTGGKDKIVMKSLWERLLNLVPDIVSFAESVAKITSLLT